jgi:hypothetical protein
MNNLIPLLILSIAMVTSLSITDSYGYDPLVFNMTITDVQSQQFAGYDIITLDFELVNTGLEDVILTEHSQIYLNDTKADYWEYINYQDFGLTSSECPLLDTTAFANSTSSLKLCFLTTDEIDVGYSLVIADDTFVTENQPNEFVLESVPNWFTTTANAWCTDVTSDPEYLNSVEFNIQQGNIDVLRTQSGVDLGAPIPAWVKTNACDWSNGSISDYEFLDGIYWLIDNGKVQLD